MSSNFGDRPLGWSSGGGQFEVSKFFSGETATPFYGIAYKYNDNLLIKIERDTISARDFSTPLVFEESNNRYSLGFDYLLNENFSLGASFEKVIIFLSNLFTKIIRQNLLDNMIIKNLISKVMILSIQN